ncbi:hypothetical protein L2D08_01925 [Domibacillus sp. PGB-M46]|uniref:hypothetical protein n=1 Tax=Domibacillus sp. PGB-M46 TaxID=2910255 RepID=UPI001F5935B8|nr:hypothetical protein [Domibacillus sp. PGB-M46]MCI2253118.1 hypothetical protein [Domibacillus sp. PGB-M46]
MRKFIKIALLVLLLVVVAGAGAVYYFTNVKEYDVADKEVDKIIEDPYSIAYPEATPLPGGVQKDEEGLVVVDKRGNFILQDGSTMSPDEWFSSPEYTKAVSPGAANTASGSAGAAADGTTGGNADTAAPAGGSSSGTPSANGNSAGSSGNGTSSGSSNSAGGSGGGTANNNSGSAGGAVTVDTIKSRYAGSFSSLEGQVDSQLNSLISQAKAEYGAKQAAGETVNPAYFYQKYSGAASGVEAKTDAAFNSLYTGLTSELKANGFSASHAEQYKTEYEATKEARKNELLSKVAGK